jgi:hypothetical protein
MSSERKFGKLLERAYRNEDLHLSPEQARVYAHAEFLHALVSKLDIDEDERAMYLWALEELELPPRSTPGAPAGVGKSEARFYVGALADIGKRDYRNERGRQRIGKPIINAIYNRAIDMVEDNDIQWRGAVARPGADLNDGEIDITTYNFKWSEEMERRIDIAFPDAERQLRAAWKEAEAHERNVAERKRRAAKSIW